MAEEHEKQGRSGNTYHALEQLSQNWKLLYIVPICRQCYQTFSVTGSDLAHNCPNLHCMFCTQIGIINSSWVGNYGYMNEPATLSYTYVYIHCHCIISLVFRRVPFWSSHELLCIDMTPCSRDICHIITCSKVIITLPHSGLWNIHLLILQRLVKLILPVQLHSVEFPVGITPWVIQFPIYTKGSKWVYILSLWIMS